MGILMGWISAILLAAAIGSLLGWLAFFQVRDLRQQLQVMRAEITGLRRRAEDQSWAASTDNTAADTETRTGTATAAHQPDLPPRTETSDDSSAPKRPVSTRIPATAATAAASAEWQVRALAPRTAPPPPQWLQHLLANWMVWLGGASVALAGIFMVKYGIDTGLLGPTARISLALITGIGLHVAAEWLRRRTSSSDPAFAALAGGASITLYGALLAALHLYQLLDPRWVFLLLAAVSLATMALALLHGPVLAGIGLIGAYIVPVLVSDNSGNIVGAMIYSLIVSGAALLLLRYVYRPWLWWGVVAGALGWWLISLSAHQSADFRGLYLALLAWGLVAIPAFDWLLRGTAAGTRPPTEVGARPAGLAAARMPGATVFTQGLRLDQISLALVILAWGISIYQRSLTANAFGLWAPLAIVIFFAARRRDALSALPWLTLLVQWLAWLLLAIRFDHDLHQFALAALDQGRERLFLTIAGSMAVLYSGLALLHLRARGFAHGWLALALLAPLAWLALAWLLVNGLSQSLTWSLVTLMGGAAYGTLAGLRLQRRQRDGVSLWLTLGAHGAYSLAVAMYFREAGLSVALAAQILSLSWLLQRHQLPWLGLIVKAVLAVVLIRLTFNPWLLSYPADVHWSLWTYGGATAFCALAARQCRADPGMYRWLSAATLHLLVMTLGAEVRYWLYDGAIFVHRYTLTESAINASLWAAMALTYQYRAVASENFRNFYRTCSRVLLALATTSFLVSLTTNNPWWSVQQVGATPVFNILLLAYGLPVVLAILVGWYHEQRFRRPAFALSGAGLLVFASLEIRHLWQEGHLALARATGEGELYTYSIAWLALAIGAILGGARWRLRDLYKAGMALLAVVIAKIFLVDMSDLQGLWRVASFMGLGLTLLGLAWLHGRMHDWQHQNSTTGAR